MNNNLFLAILAGLFFGIWPICMNSSGLKGYLGAAAFTFFSLIIVGVVAGLGDKSSIYQANWYFLVAAGISGAIGLLFFTKMLGQADPKDLGPLLIIALLMQFAAPVIQNYYLTREVSMDKLIGLSAAVIAVLYLKK